MTSSGASAGRVSDTSTYGDYANLFGQAYAAGGLTTAGSTDAASVTSYLLKQQCAAGYFALTLSDASAATPTCDATGGTPSVDATGLAVLELAAQRATPAVAASLAKAKTWLASVQKSDGSFTDGTTTGTANANSTGFGGAALGTLGDTDAAGKAAVWIREHQVQESGACTDALAGNQGTVGYDDTTLSTARTAGLPTAAVVDTFRRATTQGSLVLPYAPDALGNTTPRAFTRKVASPILKITGISPGQSVCVTRGSTTKLLTGDADGLATTRFTGLPAAGVSAYSITTSTSGVYLRSVGAKRLSPVPSKSKVHRKGLERIVVRGLAAGEVGKVRVYGHTYVGVANKNGRFGVSFRVGKRVGTVKVRTYGSFAGIRHGSTSFKVVR